jgi:serine/threonine-protein kinase HipA
MKINTLVIDIIRVLIDKNSYTSLKEIISLLAKHKITPRHLQNELKQLIDTNRVSVKGQASTTQYAIEEMQSNYRQYEFLYVFKGYEIAGILFKLKDRYRFYYDNNFIANKSKEIPSLSLQLSAHDFENIPAVFEENIPEGINREILETKSKTADEFEILSMLTDNIGNLSFSKSKEIEFPKNSHPNFISSLNEILGTNPKINLLENFSINIEEKHLFPDEYDISKQEIKQAHGISGFQYKKLVNIDFENNSIISDDSAHLYILKPYSKPKANKDNENYFPHISINEHLFMSFAKNELNFRVPYSAIIKRKEDEEFHYIVKRFDRNGVHRFAKSTFAVFLGLRSENKYDTTSEKLFTRISKEIHNPKEKLELLKHYVYSVIIQHEDMHTKNLSLIYDREFTFFSPLYDIACTGIMDGAKKYDSHLTINGKQKQIRPNDFRPLCKILNVEFTTFKTEAIKIAIIYKESLPIYIEELKKLGSIPFYKRKLTQKAGGDSYWKASKEPIEFYDVLKKFHFNRIKELENLGWIKEN